MLVAAWAPESVLSRRSTRQYCVGARQYCSAGKTSVQLPPHRVHQETPGKVPMKGLLHHKVLKFSTGKLWMGVLLQPSATAKQAQESKKQTSSASTKKAPMAAETTRSHVVWTNDQKPQY